ncbi:L-asparaginase II [Paenibacillus curdlanolyticus YK9]|uniref:L-asparaginase II n=1 Tax=Paenibacillus curdlanolyticus YK9 TaxID=717606 RepID=E0I9U8_9BACL|nr:asparaginase [Paenibacillus curdlanolyticus]EFM10525.1 L-asparaginase II [Paenibacillus curdlanolyticus YK9]
MQGERSAQFTANEIGGIPLAIMLRGGQVENVHNGHIAVVDSDGRLVAGVGSPDVLTFMRSTAKPLQAIPILRAGVIDAYGLTNEAIAMLTASHRGEPAHLAALLTMLRQTGVKEEQLVFHAGLPLDGDARDEWIKQGGPPRKLFHNCAGKHIGLLAACQLNDWPMTGYAEPDHPIQQEIKQWISFAADVPVSSLSGGFDGCGLPVYAIPLRKLALVYARLAAPPTGWEDTTRAIIERITSSMNERPELVEGTGRLASLLLSGPQAIAKSGAQGVFAVGLRQERLGLIVKVSDGTEPAWPIIVSEALKQLAAMGIIDQKASQTLSGRIDAAFAQELRNDAGRIIGKREAVFQLDSYV